MSTHEITAEQVCETVRELSSDRLRLVLRFVEDLKAKSDETDLSEKKSVAPLYTVHTAAVKTGIADLAHQHDHYLYGQEFRDA